MQFTEGGNAVTVERNSVTCKTKYELPCWNLTLNNRPNDL